MLSYRNKRWIIKRRVITKKDEFTNLPIYAFYTFKNCPEILRYPIICFIIDSTDDQHHHLKQLVNTDEKLYSVSIDFVYVQILFQLEVYLFEENREKVWKSELNRWCSTSFPNDVITRNALDENIWSRIADLVPKM